METVGARAPLRISLGGGGTDLPSHFTRHGGFVVSAAIDRHVHMLVSTAFAQRVRLKHLEFEEVDDAAEIRHPILRAAIARHWNGRPLELASLGDVPPGTGLGSSGAYTVCAVKALELAGGNELEAGELAERACRIELDDVGRTVGKQDQYAAAFGGVNALTFHPDGTVDVRPLGLAPDTLTAIRERLLLFFTGRERSAAEMLAGQVQRSGTAAMTANLVRTEQLAHRACAALERGDLDALGDLMAEQWELKRERQPASADPAFERLREAALDAGARGAMIMGAGGGGFLLACSDDPPATRAAMAAAGAPELPFGVDLEGCRGWRAAGR